MLKTLPTPGKLQRLIRRQSKKHRVGEFQEFVFEVRAAFRQPLDEAGYDVFLDEFIEMIESRQLCVGGMGEHLPLAETSGVVQSAHRGSPSDEDRQFVANWLRQRPEVASADVGELVDGWYGWD